MQNEKKTEMLYLFCMLISSTFMIHSRKTLDNTALTQLASACQILVDLDALAYVRGSNLFYVLRDTENYRIQGRRVSATDLMRYFANGKHTDALFDVIELVYPVERSQFVCKMSSPPKDANDEEILRTERDFLRKDLAESRMFQSFLTVIEQVGEHSHAKRLDSDQSDQKPAQNGINMHISEIIFQMRSITTLINDNKLEEIPNKLASYMLTRMKKMKKKRLKHFVDSVQNDSTVDMMHDEISLRRYLQSLQQSYLEEFHKRMESLLESKHSHSHAVKTIRSLNKRLKEAIEQLVWDWKRVHFPESVPPAVQHDHRSFSRSRKRKRELSGDNVISAPRDQLQSRRGFHFSDHVYKWSDTFHDHSSYTIYVPSFTNRGIKCDQCGLFVDDYEVYSVGTRMCAVRKRNGKNNGFIRMELPVTPAEDVCHVQCYEGNASLSDVLFDEDVRRFNGFEECPKSIRDYYLMCSGQRKNTYSLEVPKWKHRSGGQFPSNGLSPTLPTTDQTTQDRKERPLLLGVRKRPVLSTTDEPTQEDKKSGKRPAKRRRIVADAGSRPTSLPATTAADVGHHKIETTQELLDESFGKKDAPITNPAVPEPSFFDDMLFPISPDARYKSVHRLSLKSPHLSPIEKSRTPTLQRFTHKEAWTPDLLSPLLRRRSIPHPAETHLPDELSSASSVDKSTKLTICDSLTLTPAAKPKLAKENRPVTMEGNNVKKAPQEKVVRPLAIRPKQRVFKKNTLPPPSKPIAPGKSPFRVPKRKLERFSKLELSASSVDITWGGV